MGCFWLGLPGPVISDHSLAIQWLESLSNSIKGESPSKTLALHSSPFSSDRNPLPLFPSLRSAAPPPQIPRWFLLHHRWSRRSSLASSRWRPRVSRRPPPPPEPLLVRSLSLSPGRVEEHGEVKPRAGLSEREERRRSPPRIETAFRSVRKVCAPAMAAPPGDAPLTAANNIQVRLLPGPAVHGC